MNKIKFTYKNNVYLRYDDGSFRIRSNANVDGRGYSYFFVKNKDMIKILTDFVDNMEE